MGRGALWRDNQQKHVRTHRHKLKPLNHFTVVPHPLSPLRYNKTSSAGAAAQWPGVMNLSASAYQRPLFGKRPSGRVCLL